eukprot:TRINITY_DN58634_c0_g1_i1.p1 TRINITY_DN58634_c0_g1~~TRINITY_DN58634_c0_g1_i1.p1  ORF type:complete len:513 (+),score=115.24 TRINITY_DN58634_c0_g1_i1:64-1602(+)
MLAAMSGITNAVEIAEQWEKLVDGYFKSWDTDGGGTIDKEELESVLHRVMVTVQDSDVDRIFAAIDVKGEGEIDLDQFNAWITNRTAAKTVAIDGFIEDFNLREAVLPLFQVFDKNGDGTISSGELATFSLILTNALSLHPLKTRDHLVCEWDSSPFDHNASFDEFVAWQAEVLENSGIPNNQLPQMFHELSEGLHAIFGIENLTKTGSGEDPQTEGSLKYSIKRVADAARFIYTQNKYTLVLDAEELREEENIIPSRWITPPVSRDFHVLAKLLASKNVQLEGFSVMDVAAEEMSPRTPAGSRRSSKVGLGSASHAGSRLGSKASVSPSPEASESTVRGRLVLCIPDVNMGKRKIGIAWFAKVLQMSRMGVEKGYLMFRWVHTSKRWEEMLDAAKFDRAWRHLPSDLRMLALLKAKCPADDKLSLPASTEAMHAAMQDELMHLAAIHEFRQKVSQLAEEAMLAGLSQEQLESLEEEGNFEEILEHYLENDFSMTPEEVMDALKEWNLLPTA